jgi:hypothetical protein
MKEVKSAKTQKRLVVLPPQESATDTSNWENRNVSAPHIDIKLNKRVMRDVEFVEPENDSNMLTLEQIKKLQARERAKKTSE